MMMGSGGDGKPMVNHHVYLEISWKLTMETTFCRKYHGNHNENILGKFHDISPT